MLLCMRTTVEIEDRLFARLRAIAARNRRTFKEVLAEVVRLGLKAIDDMPAGGEKTRWKVHHCGRPRVDVTNRGALMDFMDRS